MIDSDKAFQPSEEREAFNLSAYANKHPKFLAVWMAACAWQRTALQPALIDEQEEFEKWAEPRGYSLERTTDSYKSQGTKSAWRGWKGANKVRGAKP